MFDGVEVVSVDGRLWESGPLPADLGILGKPDKLFEAAQAEVGDLPSFIRVGAPYMDLWYNYFDPDQGAGEVALVSHLGMAKMVGHFIRQCHDDIELSDSLEATLHDVLGERFPIRDGDHTRV